jgi:hypothetical protein
MQYAWFFVVQDSCAASGIRENSGTQSGEQVAARIVAVLQQGYQQRPSIKLLRLLPTLAVNGKLQRDFLDAPARCVTLGLV